jgi:hypothetical protein
MELLAPFQYVASSSCSIFHFNIELSHTRQSDDIATLHTPIAILLSHLQALYNNIIILAFVIAISLFSGHCRRRGRRGRHHNSTTAPTGGGQRYRKRRSRRGLRRLHCYTKVGSRDRGLVAERLTDVNYALCQVKYRASYGASPNDRLNYIFK